MPLHKSSSWEARREDSDDDPSPHSDSYRRDSPRGAGRVSRKTSSSLSFESAVAAGSQAGSGNTSGGGGGSGSGGMSFRGPAASNVNGSSSTSRTKVEPTDSPRESPRAKSALKMEVNGSVAHEMANLLTRPKSTSFGSSAKNGDDLKVDESFSAQGKSTSSSPPQDPTPMKVESNTLKRMPASISPTTESSPNGSGHGTPAGSMSPPLVKKESKESLKSGKKSKTPTAKSEPQLYGHLPDATEEATSTFEVIQECIYSSKTLADSGHDSEMMICDCDANFVNGINHACDEDSDCINRLTLMECTNDGCGCHSECKNQRFQTHDYADISVFKTAKKGYGIRANSDIPANRFIYEYVGEVIDEPRFRARNVKYPAMGIKHFYFMSMEKDQFIDATMKGGLARFVNHSCNPNCETEKWIVGNKFRMGIFSKRDIQAGEELVFDYNVDRYGAEKQPCYCGEPNCLGYIGGKTQTNGAPKLSGNLKDALGIDDDELPTKKSRKVRKTAEDDEEYLARAGSKALDFNSVTTLMSTLSNTKEKWIVSKLVARIQRCDDEAVLGRVLQFHGYTIIGKFLSLYKDDDDIVSTILSIFISFPKLTKNKITAANIEPTVQQFTSSPVEEISSKAKELLSMWNALETSYRIPRRTIGDQASTSVFLDRGRDSRSTSRTESPKRSPKSTEPIPPWIANKNKQQFGMHNNKPAPTFAKQPPTGPRNDQFRNRMQMQNRPPGNHFAQQRQQYPNPNMVPTPTQPKMYRNAQDLPRGWHKCYQFNECYYYANDGRVSWDVPTQHCNAHGPPSTIPPPPPKPGIGSQLKDIQALIQEAAAAAEADRKRKEEEEKEKEQQERRARRKEREAGKTFSAEKTRKYLTVAFGKIVPNMVNKFNKDLGSTPKSAKENVKKYSREIVELLVDKEIRYHKHHVVDPLNVCDESKIAKVKLFVDEYIRKLIERRKAAKAQLALQQQQQQQQQGESSKTGEELTAEDAAERRPKSPEMKAMEASPSRKRGHEDDDAGRLSPKRQKSQDHDQHRE